MEHEAYLGDDLYASFDGWQVSAALVAGWRRSLSGVGGARRVRQVAGAIAQHTTRGNAMEAEIICDDMNSADAVEIALIEADYIVIRHDWSDPYTRSAWLWARAIAEEESFGAATRRSWNPMVGWFCPMSRHGLNRASTRLLLEANESRSGKFLNRMNRM